jgi:hypothetical protein
MNRLVFWLYALIVLGLGVLAVHSQSVQRTAAAVAAVDARLETAAGQVKAALAATEAAAAGLADRAGRDPGLAAVLAPPAPPPPPEARPRRGAPPPPPAPAADPAADEARLQEAARAALGRAEEALGLKLPDAATVLVATRAGLVGRDVPESERGPFELLVSAIEGKAARATVVAGERLQLAAASPAGPDAGVVVLVPLDVNWAAALEAATGAKVTLAVGGKPGASTARADAKRIADAALAVPGRTAPVGRAGPVDLDLPVALPRVPALFAQAPELRARAVPLEGVKGGFAVLSLPVGPGVAPVVRVEWIALASIAGLALLALLLGMLLRTEIAPQVPADLLAAAARIEKGEFGARAPALAGKFGTLAAALNRAAEAAARPAGAPPSVTEEFFAKPPPAPDPNAFEFPPRATAAAVAAGAPEPALGGPFGAPPAPAPAAAPAPDAFGAGADPFSGPGAFPFPAPPPPAPPVAAVNTTLRIETGAVLGGGAFEAAPVPARAASPSAADLLGGAARAAPAATAADDEEAHWQGVFADFLRVRAECGEPAEGLTYDRFRVKLEKNRDQLVQKYGCRTVRFQVYVKEGKAALKATPVR